MNDFNDNEDSCIIEIPHFSKPYFVANNKVYADNAYDAALTNVGEGQVPCKVGDDWAAFVRKGGELVQVGETFKVALVKRKY